MLIDKKTGALLGRLTVAHDAMVRGEIYGAPYDTKQRHYAKRRAVLAKLAQAGVAPIVVAKHIGICRQQARRLLIAARNTRVWEAMQ